MNNQLHFSSATDEWATPQDLFDKLNSQFHFTLDVCASDTNHKCEQYFTIEDNALSKDWGINVCWCNPPYSKGKLKHFIKKAHEESLKGATVVCLIPSRTDTRYWQDYIWSEETGLLCHQIIFIKDRLKFGGHKNPAPFPSAIIIFKKD